MTNVQKIQLRQSELRKQVNDALAIPPDERPESWESDMAKRAGELSSLETQLQAAVLAEEPVPETRSDTPEGRELRSMIEGANIGNILAAVMEKRSTDGRELELQQHYNIAPHAIPLELLEIRAVTPAPTNVERTPRPVVQPVFALGDAAYLGVDMPTVPAGDLVYPVLTSRPTVGGPHRDSTSVGETTGAFSADVLTPGRLQASFFYRRTDAARFPSMGDALRMALNSGLSEALDKEVIDQVITDVSQTDASAEDDFASYRSRFVYSLVDGRYAMGGQDLRLLMASDVYAHAGEKYRADENADNALRELMAITGGVRVSPHLAAADATTHKGDVLVRRGMRDDAIAPLWQGVTLIPDEVTKADTGEIVITAVLLAAFKVTRADGFARIAAQIDS